MFKNIREQSKAKERKACALRGAAQTKRNVAIMTLSMFSVIFTDIMSCRYDKHRLDVTLLDFLTKHASSASRR